MKSEYDLIFGLGPACSCSQAIRRAGLQLLSFPFDWIGPTYGHPGWDSDVRRRADLICSKFEDWLRPEDFTFHGQHTNGKDKYFNTRHGLIFLHDFPAGIQFDKSFPEIASKYERRCTRLLELIKRSHNVLLVRLDRPDLDYRTPVEDCRYAREALTEHFAPTRFDFALLQEDPSCERGACREEEIEDGFLRLSFDYRDRRPAADPRQPDKAITAEVLRQRFTIRDYRTEAELSEWEHKQRLKHYARYGATNTLQYYWRKLMAALGESGKENA